MAKKINRTVFKKFFESEKNGGIILMFCVAISLGIANSDFAESFSHLLTHNLGFNIGSIPINYTVSAWINDGLMAIFFLLVGLEIKRELIEGELSSVKNASLPVLAAMGGMIVPAGIYFLFNQGTETAHGWGIPMATDIAFALAIIAMLGKSVPASLKIFLAALAIVDDLGAILVIAVFYTDQIHWNYLYMAGGVLTILVLLNYFKVKSLWFYLIPGIFLWYFVHHSGIHATIAGVLTAITLPTNDTDQDSPLEKLEHFLSTPVNFIIMPIFAIANTNITFLGGMVEGLATNMGMGIILGLFLGKPIGIFFMSWLAVKLNLGKLPEGANWIHILGLGLLGGIGFTMSIFIALLSFKLESYQIEAKFAILVASFISGLMGFMLLNLYNKKQTKAKVATTTTANVAE